jgi:hypothetical protein
MKREELLIYNQTQMELIQEHKWIMSEKMGYDVGDKAVLDWINTHSQRFREEWYHENGLD